MSTNPKPNPRKYLFDRDFGPRPVPVAPPPEAAAVEQQVVVEEPPPMFTEDELSLARDAAFEEGRRRGMEDAAALDEARIAQGLTAIAAAMDSLHQRQEIANDEAARDAVRVAFAAVRKVLPAACRTYAFDEAAHTVEEVIGDVLDEPRIIVRVAEDLVPPLRDRLEAVAESHGFEGRVVVQGDGRIALGDCRVEWTDGGAERDHVRLIAEVEAAMERALAPPEKGPAATGEIAGVEM